MCQAGVLGACITCAVCLHSVCITYALWINVASTWHPDSVHDIPTVCLLYVQDEFILSLVCIHSLFIALLIDALCMHYVSIVYLWWIHQVLRMKLVCSQQVAIVY